ncbi:MAG: hypothetical protein P8Q35_04650 [Candidatus Thalassarchaeaceae archaeon]|nr:hypothetical protein [Candidatus Thalassarchaeaceae archaeon]
MMRTQSAALGMLLMLIISTSSAGCIGLVMQREIMEDLREEPTTIMKEESFLWDVTFETNSLDGVQYNNQTQISLDATVSKITITFRAFFPYSDSIGEITNETDELRFVEAILWEPGVKESGGNPFWQVKTTQDYPLERFEFSNIVEGNWLVEIDARGYGFTAPIDQFSAYDHFDMSVTITKPCVHFPEVHDKGDCTDLSAL